MTYKSTCVLVALVTLLTLGYSQSLEDLSAKVELGTHLYIGDLNYKLKAPKRAPSYRLSMAYRLTPSLGISLGYQWGTVYGNDRLYSNDEVIVENEYYRRALNFKTSLKTANLLAVYHFNNGKVMKEGSRVAPYVFAGLGLSFFKTKADLYYGANNTLRYFYWSDGTIRDQPEGDNLGEIIFQDEDFETDVNAINTENGDAYPTSFLQIPVGAGVKVNLSKHFTVDASLTAHLLFSDNLDDVSGDYPEIFDNSDQAYASNPSFTEGTTRGNPNGNNDFLLTPAIGLTYHFGKLNKRPGDEFAQTTNTDITAGSKVDPFFAVNGDHARLAPIVAPAEGTSFSGRDTVYILKRDTVFKSATGSTINTKADKAKVNQFENEVLESEFGYEMTQLKKEISQLKDLYQKTGESSENLAMTKLEEELTSLRKKNGELQLAAQMREESQLVKDSELVATLTPEVKSTTPKPTAEERISNMRKSVPPAPKGSETAALQGLFEQLAYLNDEIEKLKGKNERFENLLVKVESQNNTRPVSPMASATSADGGLGLIYPTLHKERIYFRTGQQYLSPSQKEHLDAITPLLVRYPNLGILITGHTDKAGNPASNLVLSRRRAEAVKAYFLSNPAIKDYQIMTNYFGPAIPSQEIQGNSTVSQFDRRVEIDYLKVK